MSFDPYEQNITLTASDGSTMDIPLPFFDEYVQEGVVSCINYGCQLGATIVTFVLLCLLTRSKKRSSIIFCLNVIALLLNMFRLICEVLIYTSAWFETYAYFTGDISRVSRGDFANSVLVSVMDALLQVLMEASLVKQTKVVSTNMSRWQKATILAASLALATSSIGFRMAQMVLESMLIVKNMPFTGYIWLQKVNTILTTTSIIYFSIVLVCKLGYTIYRRKQLGVHQLSPMQIIFIMSCQTMIVPCKFFTSFRMSIANIYRSRLLNLAVLIRQHSSYQQRHRYLCGGFAACDNPVGCHCTTRSCSCSRCRIWCASLEQAFNIATQ
jgi:pheromone alpha factor receptor